MLFFELRWQRNGSVQLSPDIHSTDIWDGDPDLFCIQWTEREIFWHVADLLCSIPLVWDEMHSAISSSAHWPYRHSMHLAQIQISWLHTFCQMKYIAGFCSTQVNEENTVEKDLFGGKAQTITV